MSTRRKFLYTSAGVAAAAGIGYLTKDYWHPLPGGSLVESHTPTTSTPENNPPYANFELVRPRYIKPCVGQEVQFVNKSTDRDGDPLTFKWYADDKLESESKDFSTRFNEIGQHRVKLEVSDGKLKDEKEYSFLDVESDQIYPMKQLHVREKGIRYCAGNIGGWPNMPTPGKEEMDEQLDIIRNELGCNAITIVGGGEYEDNIILCAKLAIEKNFERVN
ncbi:MAG: PKD domain-containing protein, partial [Candidatus Bathyarchaeota archaeon]|nr:PKD domain-containing protein [Candidatus Bathyarchaeota archaeon]